MNLSHFARSAYRTFTTAVNGPTIYDVCAPLLSGPDGQHDYGAHIRNFYKTAIANPALRPLLARAGLPQLRDQARLRALTAAIQSARDDEAPDWREIGRPLGELIDDYPQRHPNPSPLCSAPRPVSLTRIEVMIRGCAEDLLDCYDRRGFLPAYAAFNLIGDPDFHGKDLMVALDALNARTYKNATLLFNLARAFLLGNPHVAGMINPPWGGIAEPMWEPVQIRHRTAYYDAFFIEALVDFLASDLATPAQTKATKHALDGLIEFCLHTSRERVAGPKDGKPYDVITALVPPPHCRLTKFFWKLKSDLGFSLYVPDCDTTACSFSAAAQAGSKDPVLDVVLPDFYAQYQVGHDNQCNLPTVSINDNIDFDGGIATWIQNIAGDRPYGNDLDPTLALDVLEVSFRNHEKWQIVENPKRLDTMRRIVKFQQKIVASGEFAKPRSHIYYLPELYAAYFGRCWSTFQTLPESKRRQIDPDGVFTFIRKHVLDYVCGTMLPAEMNPFDAALALLALAKLKAPNEKLTPALAALDRTYGEGRLLGRGSPFKAYEWNKMKTPTRILVGGPEVTSAFVLSALVHARKALAS